MPVKIKKIKVYQVKLPLKKSLRISGGRLHEHRMDSTIVSVTTNNGLTGWGEACSFGSSYLPAFVGGTLEGIAELAPLLMGESPLRLDQINQVMDSGLSGHWYAKSALDVACWDILGKYAKLPLYTLLGGHFSDYSELLGVFTNGSPEEMVTDMKRVREEGYRILGPKIGGDVALDVARIKALLKELQPGEKMTIDANRAWLPDQAIQIMNSIDDMTPYFEQPCETLRECLAVRRMTRQPIILDECIHTFSDLLWAQQNRVAEAISIKIGRVGGLTKAHKMRDFCVATGLRMNIEETSASVIGLTGAIHLAVSTPLRYRLGTSNATMLHSTITATGGFVFKEGKAFLPETPGLGIEPLMEVLGEPVAVYT